MLVLSQVFEQIHVLLAEYCAVNNISYYLFCCRP
uniref:Uncharacterized protein n=1 Tax=Anguilla anguilla TaxID=7936 RepID=A0A0E9PF76_ANGAN